MQVVRNLYTRTRRAPAWRGYQRKIREAKLAEELENEHSKRWILSTYLNTVPYGTLGGQTAIGVKAAARMFFSKPVEKLTLRESALLAGLPQAPTDYSPIRSRGAAKTRRNEVLRQDGPAGDDLAPHRGAHHAPQPRRRDLDLLLQAPRELLRRLRQGRAAQGVRRPDGAQRRHARLHDDRPQEAAGGAHRDQQQARGGIGPSSGDRHDRSQRTATSRRWPPRPTTASRSTTSPRRATASRARRSR